MKFLFKFLDRMAPGIAAKIAYNFISNPRVNKLREFEEKVLRQAGRNQVSFREFQIEGYVWGEENRPIALLVHGWEGQAGNFSNLVSTLTDKGYQVIAYDGPSHGKSTKRATNMFEYADFITERIKEHQPKIIISHSFGSITTLLGLTRNLQFKLNQWVIVTTPFSFKEHIEKMKTSLGLTHRTTDKLVRLLERNTELTIDELNVETSAKLINVHSCTIIHSEADRVIPINDSRRAHQCISGSELIEPKNLGHYRILWSDELKEIIEAKIDPERLKVA